MNPIDLANRNLNYAKNQRRRFHRHPELAFEEKWTSSQIVKELCNFGLQPVKVIGELGVVCTVSGPNSGRTRMFRFDIDALPVQEETGLSFSSEFPGRMHACGHDGHIAIGLTFAKILSENTDMLEGDILLVFQPAEEQLEGAKAMIDAGLFNISSPDAAFGLHIWNDKPLGWFGIKSGPVMASSDRLNVVIHGRGGHAASPNLTTDPLLVAVQVVSELQTIISRKVSPLDAAVLSITRIVAGTTFNVIPTEAEFEGTIRTLDTVVRNQIVESVTKIVHHHSEASGCSEEISVRSMAPVLMNDPEITKSVRARIESLIPGVVIDDTYQTMGSEDMAIFLERVPGCYIFIGSSNENEEYSGSHHTPQFNFDEQVLRDATIALLGIAITQD